MNSFFDQSSKAPINLSASEIIDIQTHGFSSYVTDPEGDYQKFLNRLAQNDSLIRQLKDRYPQLNHAKINYVFGGDMTDKGKGNIEILEKVKDLQKKHNVQLLMGNRDHNKIRFKEALNPRFRTHFHKLDAPYGYISGWNCSPKKYLTENIESLAKQFQFSLEGESLEEKWNNIPQAKQTLCILQYLCEKTMGAPDYIIQLKASFIESGYGDESNHDLFLAYIFHLHFQEKHYKLWASQGAFPCVLFKDTPHFQADYRDAARYGYVAKNRALYLHSAHNTYPYLQSGKKLSWSIRNQAKLELLAAVILTGGVDAALVFLSSMPTLMFPVIGLLVVSALYLYLRAYQTANKELFARWIDARDKEDKLNIADYLNLPLEDMHHLDEKGHYIVNKDHPGLLIQHPAVAAALPNDSTNSSYKHLAISFNSAKNPLSHEYVYLMAEDAKAKLLLVGHQPAATAQMTSYFGLALVECDTSVSTITNECGGGVVIGHHFLSIQSYQDKEMLLDSRIIYGCRHRARYILDDLNEKLDLQFQLNSKKVYITCVGTIDGKEVYKCYQAEEWYNDLTPGLFPCSGEELEIHVVLKMLENALTEVSKSIEDKNSDSEFLKKANQAVIVYKDEIERYQEKLNTLSSAPRVEASSFAC